MEVIGRAVVATVAIVFGALVYMTGALLPVFSHEMTVVAGILWLTGIGIGAFFATNGDNDAKIKLTIIVVGGTALVYMTGVLAIIFSGIVLAVALGFIWLILIPTVGIAITIVILSHAPTLFSVAGSALVLRHKANGATVQGQLSPAEADDSRPDHHLW